MMESDSFKMHLTIFCDDKSRIYFAENELETQIWALKQTAA